MRKCWFLAAAAFVITLISVPGRAQNLPWLSPQRLSLSLASTYFFNPWDNYNNALARVTDRIRLDPYFVEPEGYYEEINGDLALQGTLSYKILGRIAARVTGQYGQSSSQFEFYPEPDKLPESAYSDAFHQELNWEYWSVGAGASYQVPVANRWHLKISADVERYSAHLNLKWRQSYYADGPLPEDEGDIVQANFEDQTWGGRLTAAVQWQCAGPLVLVAGASYRFTEFDQLEGPAAYSNFYLENVPFTAALVEAPNYFGVRIKEKGAGEYDFFLPPLTFLTSPDENARVPAKVDLSSFGLTLGIQVGF